MRRRSGRRLPHLRRDESHWSSLLRRVRGAPRGRVGCFGRPPDTRAADPCHARSCAGAGRRAPARHRPLRRSRRLHRAVRGPRRGDGARAAVGVLRARRRGHHAVRRHGREVHRRRGHGRVGCTDRPRGRCRARRPSGARPGRRGPPAWAGDQRAGRRTDWRGGGHARCHEPGHGRRRSREHGLAPPVRGSGRGRARR